MCIRDRIDRFKCTNNWISKVCKYSQRENIQCDSRSDTVASVSYTHLRAHETVLDIVCRLLLEKKKKKSDDKSTTTIDKKQTTKERLIKNPKHT